MNPYSTILRMVRYFFVLFLLSHTAFSQPGNIRFYNYGFEDGLESASVNTIAEDAFGFLWAGTDDGLYRFDGYSFTNYKNTYDRDIGLGHNSITAMLPMTNGDLWVGTREGLHTFSAETGRFTRLPLDTTETYISRILYDADSNLWIGSRNGVYHHSLAEGSTKRIFPEPEEPIGPNRVYDLLIDTSGRIWLTTSGNGIFIYSPAKGTFMHLGHDENNPASLSSNSMRKMTRLPDGRIAAGTADAGVNLIDPESLEITRFTYNEDDPESLSAHSAFSLLSDRDGNIWIGTWTNGLNLFDPVTGVSRHYNHNPDDPYSIPHNSVISLTQSSDGDIWLGTSNGGLSRFNQGKQKITRYQRNSKLDNTLLTSYVRSVYEDEEGILWIGTAQNGLHRFDRSTGNFAVYIQSDGSRDALARSTIWSISPGNDGILWLGTSRGVGKFNKHTGQVRFYEPDDDDPGSISTNNILKVLDDGKGSLWIGTWYGGLDRLDIENETFTHYTFDSADPGSLNSNNINEIYYDSRGRLWVADSENLNLLDETSGDFIKYKYDVFGIDEDSAGNLWLATGSGLIRFDPENGDCTLAIREQEGLISDQVNSVVIDQDGILWAGTTKGVERINPLTLEIDHLDAKSGLAGNHQDARSVFINERTGTLYFGGRQGLSEIHPGQFKSTEKPARVVLTDFLIFNKKVNISDSTQLKQSLHTTPRIKLDFSDKLVALEFAALTFHDPEKIRYKYILDGFDEDWVETDASDRKAVYTNLPPGTYTFKVNASNTHGEFSEENITSITLLVVPPWWQTWWAKALLYAGICVLGYLLFNYRMEIIQKQNKRLEEQVRARTAEVQSQRDELAEKTAQLKKINHQKNRLFSIIGHDLRSPLNSLRGIMPLLNPDILNSKDLHTIKNDIGERIDSVKVVIENLLYWAKGQLEGEIVMHSNFSLNAIVAEKVALFDPEARKKNISLQNRMHEPVAIFADEHQVRTILHNLINNAIKFTGENGEIVIAAEEKDEFVILSVKDNGVGMTSQQADGIFDIATNISTNGTAGERGVGLGMLLIKDFVEKNNGRIWLESAPGIGTSFFIEFRTVRILARAN